MKPAAPEIRYRKPSYLPQLYGVALRGSDPGIDLKLVLKGEDAWHSIRLDARCVPVALSCYRAFQRDVAVLHDVS